VSRKRISAEEVAYRRRVTVAQLRMLVEAATTEIGPQPFGLHCRSDAASRRDDVERSFWRTVTEASDDGMVSAMLAEAIW